MSRLMQRSVRGLLLIAWMGVIYYFSNQSDSNQWTLEIFGDLNYFARKGAHMTEYAVLFWLGLWFQSSFAGNEFADRLLDKRIPYRRLLLPFLLTFFYAMSDEWHQSFVPNRSSLFSDVLIDSCGSGIASLVSFFTARRSS